MSNLVDRYLLFRIRTKRDPEAFAKIYDRYVAALYRFAFLKVPSKEDAQDITAETFTKAWHYLQEHSDVVHVRALLYRISRNLIVDYYRQRPPTLSLQSVTFEGDFTSTTMNEEPHDQGRGQNVIEARAELSLVLGKLEKLKEDYRDVIMLRLVDGLAFQDIATILEKSTGHVRVIYHRALKALDEHV